VVVKNIRQSIDVETGNPNSPSRSFAPLLRAKKYIPRDAIYMEQEETRAVRTENWLYMRRFKASRTHPLEDEMYDLSNDPQEKRNVFGTGQYPDIERALADQVDDYFRKYADKKYDLWNAGTTKSNTDKAYLWKDAWGESWQPVY